jgi:hypothetical protein
MYDLVFFLSGITLVLVVFSVITLKFDGKDEIDNKSQN